MHILNSEIKSIEKISLKVKEIESLFEERKSAYSSQPKEIVSIVFDKNVGFVNPLFLIMLLNAHSKYPKQALSINTTFLEDKYQIFVHRFLIQFFDYLFIEPKNTNQNPESIVTNEAIAKTAQGRTGAGKRGIVYYYSVPIYKNLEELSLEDDKTYTMLPIMSVSEAISIHTTSEKQDTRFKLYDSLVSKNDKVTLKGIVTNLLLLLHSPSQKNLFYIDLSNEL